MEGSLKKIIIVLSFIALPSLSFAADSSSGCGLGWKIVSDNSLISSYTRAMTNALTSSTFGMTSGTSGCSKHSIVKKDVEAATYAFTNFDSLKSDMSKGDGETLAGLGRLMGCNDASLGAFSSSVKSQYETVFPTANTAPEEMFYNVKSVISSNPNLVRSCSI